MRRGIATPASERGQEIRQIGAQVREIAQEFHSRAAEWLERAVGVLHERTAALGPSEHNRELQTALERLQAAREGPIHSR